MIAIRIAGVQDHGALAHLRQLWDGREEPGFERRMAAWLEDEADRRTTWLAAEDGEAVGMGSMFEYRRMPHPGEPDRRWGYVGNMFVRAEFRGRGIGGELLQVMIDAAARRGYVRLLLSPSEGAVAFYERAGFVAADASVPGDRLLVRPMPA